MNDSAAPEHEPRQERRTTWLSKGLEVLIQDLAPEPRDDADFDVLIVGSGYGGAVAASRLAGLQDAKGHDLSVCMLERGREYLSGSFPDRMADLAGHVRFTTPGGAGARGRLEGLFDVRVGSDMSVLVANGLGGGSLINAGVMEFPRPDVFDDPAWPGSIRTSYADLQRRAEILRRDLGAQRANLEGLCRTAVMVSLGKNEFRKADITVAMDDRTVTSGKVKLKHCIACGDCTTGCNHDAKASLDTNLLRIAQHRRASIYCGATVSQLRRHSAGWEVDVWHTDRTLRERMAGPLKVRGRRLVVAAGTLGSTELLMRSRTDELRFSSRLGSRFSGNADAVATLYNTSQQCNAVADESTASKSRGVGPTITSIIDLREENGFVIEDLGIAGPLRRLFEETTAIASLLNGLGKPDERDHAASDQDPCAIDPASVNHSLTVALIGRDSACGVLTPANTPPGSDAWDAGVNILWPDARDDKRLETWHEVLRKRVCEAGIGGKVLPNPMWQALPDDVGTTLGVRKGPLLTVHPIGGCPMGDDRRAGVVDDCGQVFDGAGEVPSAIHDGLVVLDGSIVPTSLGINPALTIATLADRAMDSLLDKWKLCTVSRATPSTESRPVFKTPSCLGSPQPTEVQVLERLSGFVEIDNKRHWVELSLVYKPARLADLRSPDVSCHRLLVETDPELSRVRVFADRPSKFTEAEDKDAEFVAPVEGCLTFLQHEASTACTRRCRALRAWFTNRGARDVFQEVVDRLSGRQATTRKSLWSIVRTRVKQVAALASMAGEARLFSYDLLIGAPVKTGAGLGQDLRNGEILGRKRLTYARRSNPWSQLTQLELSKFGSKAVTGTLELDLAYLARKNVPLLRIVGQQDQPSALVDLASFVLYLARVIVRIHLWSFRKPDRPSDDAPRRLPGVNDSLPAPQVFEFDPSDGRPGVVRLTRYPKPNSTRRPVLMIHGYSASGTTFAHPTVRPNLASYLWHQGIEPWIVDLRSSCGMPSAEYPWAFEDIARADIPQAIRYVVNATGGKKIDVVSHCMGSAMLSMALLDQAEDRKLNECIAHWVMSQVGPAVRMTPANVFRAYLIRYVQQLLPGITYRFRAAEGPAGFDANLMDRLIASLPYLEGEFDVDNPPWCRPWVTAPWVGTRRRIDALFGRVFDVRNMPRETLERIDDFFGPINLATASQPIHFARTARMTDRWGAYWCDPLPTARLAGIEVLSLHSENNGLADPETQDALMDLATLAGLSLRANAIEGRGHQDLLIGRDNGKVFKLIDEFLV